MNTSALFVYGTLTATAVMESLIGRRPPGKPALLTGYARFRVRDQVFPAIVPRGGGCTPGILYEGLGDQDLELLDRFEGALYERQVVRVNTTGPQPLEAFTYVLAPGRQNELTDEPWDPVAFLSSHLDQYLTTCARNRGRPHGSFPSTQ